MGRQSQWPSEASSSRADRACPERAEHRADLNVGPFATPRRSHVALVELRGNRVVARETTLAFTAAVPRFAALASCGLPSRVPRALAARRAICGPEAAESHWRK